MSLGTISVLSDNAAVGPVKFTRIAVVGDNAYPTGGTPNFQNLLENQVGDSRTIIAIESLDFPSNGQVSPSSVALEYSPPGSPILVQVNAAGLFTDYALKDPRTGITPATPLHGFSAGDAVLLVPSNEQKANYPDSKLPTGFSAETVYYVIASGLTTSAFKLAATSGGAAIVPTDLGAGLYEVQKADKLLVRTLATGAENAVGDLSGVTFHALVISV